jgi:hypothetical protein
MRWIVVFSLLTTGRPKSSELSWGLVFVRAPWLRADKQDPSLSLPTKSLYEWIYDEKWIVGSFHRDALHPDDTRLETFRLCPHIYNTITDVDNAVMAMNEWRKTGLIQPARRGPATS